MTKKYFMMICFTLFMGWSVSSYGQGIQFFKGTFDEALIPKISVPVIRAIQISDSDSQVKSQADYLLFDAPIAGSGQTFDWQLLADKQIEQDYFIAGGLTVDNVAEVKEIFHPYALDVSSGVETDGHKDLDKIKAFIERVKA